MDENLLQHSFNKIAIPSDNNAVAIDVTTQIESLEKLTEKVRIIFRNAGNGLICRLGLIIIAIAVLIYYLIGFFHRYLDEPNMTIKAWEWHYTIIRITVVSIFVSAIVFCLKMLRSYLHLYEHNRQKIAVIKAMPTLIYAIGNEEQYKLAYAKILEMILHVGNMGIINKEDDATTVNLFLELFKKVTEKDK